MLGRDRFAEQGHPSNTSSPNTMNSYENELMGQATQCVRRFAPNGRSTLRRKHRNSHITACKISDANPNEMIVSWSGDYIYSFDLVRSPNAGEHEGHSMESQYKGKDRGKSKHSSDRKRKRAKAGSSTSAEGIRRGSEPRHPTGHQVDPGVPTLQARYENGQSEDSQASQTAMMDSETLENQRESILNESQKRSMQIAKSMIKIRKLIFSLDASTRISDNSSRLSAHAPSFTSALGLAASCLPEMDEIIRSWGYPVNPDEEDVILQRTLRANRDSSRRFVQAAGTLCRLLGGQIQLTDPGGSTVQAFEEIRPRPHQGRQSSSPETFSYEFLRAICLWLSGGQQSLLQGFKRSADRGVPSHSVLPKNAKLSDIDDYLIPYLLRLAREKPIPNVDASRFEVDERRMTFQSESAAVVAFSNAIRIPLENLSRALMPASSSGAQTATTNNNRTLPAAQDRSTALMFWGFKVGRGLLLNAGKDIKYRFVETAFSGLASPYTHVPEEGRTQEDIDPDGEEDEFDTGTLIRSALAQRNAEASRPNHTENEGSSNVTNASVEEQSEDVEMHEDTSTHNHRPAIEIEDADSDSDMILRFQRDIDDDLAAYREEQANEDGADEDDEDEEDDDDDDDDSELDRDFAAEERQFMFRSVRKGTTRHEPVEADVPCSSHYRQYRGHCNIKTVKDCNFFGLQDEYVVSGSDSGHLFIWVCPSVYGLLPRATAS